MIKLSLLNKSYKLLIAGLLLTSSITPATAQTVNQELTELLNKITKFSANFNQLVTNSKGAQISSSSGQLLILKPGYLSLETKSPLVTKLLITQGNKITFYDAWLEQLTTYPANNIYRIPLSYIFLNKEINLNSTQVTKSNSCYNLVSKGIVQEFKSIDICFKDDKVSSLGINHRNGDRDFYVYSNVNYNPNLTKEDFFNNVPPDTTIVK